MSSASVCRCAPRAGRGRGSRFSLLGYDGTPPRGKAPSTPTQPHKTAHRKKGFAPPVRKKRAFLVGLYSWCSPTLWGKSPAYARAKGVTIHDIRQNCRKVPHRKRIFPAVKVTRKGTRKKGASIMVWVLPGVRCHCTRGKCVKLWAKKEPPLPLDAGELLWRPAGGRFSNSGGFCCKGGCFTQRRFLAAFCSALAFPLDCL